MSRPPGVVRHGEPHFLAGGGGVDAPGVYHGFDDAKAPSRAIGWRRGTWFGPALPRVAHFHTDLTPAVLDDEVEAGLCVMDAVGGQLAGHQLHGVQQLAWPLAQDIAHESARGR